MDGFIFVLLWVLIATGLGAWAESRGRSGVGFGLLSLFLSPLIALIFLLILKNKTEEAAAEARNERSRREEHEKQVAALMAVTGSQKTTSASPFGVSEELEKLSKLRAEGVLSDDEFNRLKQKIISV